MKDRKISRENKKRAEEKRIEESLDPRTIDRYDPTPFEAVENIRRSSR